MKLTPEELAELALNHIYADEVRLLYKVKVAEAIRQAVDDARIKSMRSAETWRYAPVRNVLCLALLFVSSLGVLSASPMETRLAS